MYLNSNITINGELTKGRTYEIVTSGWTPTYNPESEVIIRNDKGLASRYNKDYFLKLDEKRIEIIDNIIIEK
jgi:hypothetical protein